MDHVVDQKAYRGLTYVFISFILFQASRAVYSPSLL
jgi:hypothetical protein